MRRVKRWPRHTPARILETVEINQPVSLKELPALVDARPDTIRRAYFRLKATGELSTRDGRIYLGRNP